MHVGKPSPSRGFAPLAQVVDTWLAALARGEADGGGGLLLLEKLGRRMMAHFDYNGQAGASKRLSSCLVATEVFLRPWLLLFRRTVDCTGRLTA